MGAVDPADRAIAVRAELVATVLEVLVGAGHAADAGEPLVLLESMKMEIPVLAPRSGVVRSVAVIAGDHVHAGDLIAVLDQVD